MNTAITAIALANDVTITRAAEFFHGELSEALDKAAIGPDDLVALTDFGRVAALTDRVGSKKLSAMDSTEMPRLLLVTAVQDPHLAEFVEHCIKN